MKRTRYPIVRQMACEEGKETLIFLWRADLDRWLIANNKHIVSEETRYSKDYITNIVIITNNK